MAATISSGGTLPAQQPWRAARWACAGLCLIALIIMPGCGGCRKTPQQRAAEKKRKEAEQRAKELEEKRKKKPDLETGRLVARGVTTHFVRRNDET